MALDKRVLFAWASLFAVALASNGGNVPEDPVFECLSRLSWKAYKCYKQTYGFRNSRRGGRLGIALGQLIPVDYKTWPDKNDSQRSKACITSLTNFMEPLRAVLESEKDTKRVCQNTGNGLKKTLNGLLGVLSHSVHGIYRYVRHKGVHVGTLHLKPVNMTSMTSLAAQQLGRRHARRAVHLRNYVLLDYLDQVIRDIQLTRGACFNTEIDLSVACTV